MSVFFLRRVETQIILLKRFRKKNNLVTLFHLSALLANAPHWVVGGKKSKKDVLTDILSVLMFFSGVFAVFGRNANASDDNLMKVCRSLL